MPSVPETVQEPAYQYSLFDEAASEPIVNVASVPQRSPFRYPGGKTWLVPRVRRWLASRSTKPRDFVEPFGGGGIISLTVAFENLAERVTMVELDPEVAAVWRTILGSEAKWLADRIATFPFCSETVTEIMNSAPTSTPELAFKTIVRNRTNHGGILAPGSGRLKNGENGKGIGSRWYPQTLRDRILDIAKVAHKIDFIQGDGLVTMQAYERQRDAVFFIDPPYTAAGKRAGTRLYRFNEIDHEKLFSLSHSVQGDVLITYDNAEGVRHLAERYGLEWLAIPMKNTHHAAMTELLIGKDLTWA